MTANMKIKSDVFFNALEDNIESRLDGMEADVNLYPCDPETLYAVDSFIDDFSVHMIPTDAELIGSFKCAVYGAITEELIRTPVCRISCDFDDANDLGKIMSEINHALAETAAAFEAGQE